MHSIKCPIFPSDIRQVYLGVFCVLLLSFWSLLNTLITGVTKGFVLFAMQTGVGLSDIDPNVRFHAERPLDYPSWFDAFRGFCGLSDSWLMA